jgi:DNA-binding LytR/AlgR family response regulator
MVVGEVNRMDTVTIPSIMSVIAELFPNHTSIAVSDAQQYIYYKPSKAIDLNIQPGDKIKEGTLTHKALTARQKLSAYVDASVFGVAYFGMSVPIFEQGQAKGCVTAILPSKPSQLAFLTVKTSDRWIPVPYEKIMYLEAQNRKTKVKTAQIEGFHKCNLSELELMLPEDIFMRVHRSYIVNLNDIQEIQPDSHSTFLLIMKDQSKIPVSQTYASYFRRALRF